MSVNRDAWQTFVLARELSTRAREEIVLVGDVRGQVGDAEMRRC